MSHELIRPRPCCLTVLCLLQGDLIAEAIPPARNCMIRRAEAGRSPAASMSHGQLTRRPCCPTARCLLQEELVLILSLPRARNYMTRRAEAGRSRAIFIPGA